MKTRKFDRIDYPDGTHILNGEYVDYGDGAGEQIWSGNIYNKEGTCIGHADPPGPRGVQGFTGTTNHGA